METFDVCFIYMISAFALIFNWQLHAVCCQLIVGYDPYDRAVKNLVDRGWYENDARIAQAFLSILALAIFSPAVAGTWYLLGWGGLVVLTVFFHAYMLILEHLRR